MGKRENEIDLWDYCLRLLKYWWLIVICAGVCGFAALIYSSLLATPLYKSEACIYVQPNSNDAASLTPTNLSMALVLVSDYEEMITQRAVLETVITDMGLDMDYTQLKSVITVTNPEDTRFLSIAVSDPDPVKAKQIADRVCEVSAEKIMELMGVNMVKVINYGNLPVAPYAPRTMRNTALGLLIGLAGTCVFVFVLFLLDDKIKNPADVEKYLGLSTLGMIPEGEKIDDRK